MYLRLFYISAAVSSDSIGLFQKKNWRGWGYGISRCIGKWIFQELKTMCNLQGWSRRNHVEYPRVLVLGLKISEGYNTILWSRLERIKYQSINQSKTNIFHCPEINTMFSAYIYKVYRYLVINTFSLLQRALIVLQYVQLKKLVSHITWSK